MSARIDNQVVSSPSPPRPYLHPSIVASPRATPSAAPRALQFDGMREALSVATSRLAELEHELEKRLVAEEALTSYAEELGRANASLQSEKDSLSALLSASHRGGRPPSTPVTAQCTMDALHLHALAVETLREAEARGGIASGWSDGFAAIVRTAHSIAIRRERSVEIVALSVMADMNAELCGTTSTRGGQSRSAADGGESARQKEGRRTVGPGNGRSASPEPHVLMAFIRDLQEELASFRRQCAMLAAEKEAWFGITADLQAEAAAVAQRARFSLHPEEPVRSSSVDASVSTSRQVACLAAAAQEKDTTISQLERAVAAAVSERDLMLATHREAQEAAAKTSGEVQALSTLVAELRTRLDDTLTEGASRLQDAEQQCAALRDELRTVQAELLRTDADRTDYDNTMQRLRREVQDSRTAVTTAEQHCKDSLAAARAAMEREQLKVVAVWELKLAEAVHDRDDVAAQLGRAQAGLAAAEREVAALRQPREMGECSLPIKGSRCNVQTETEAGVSDGPPPQRHISLISSRDATCHCDLIPSTSHSNGTDGHLDPREAERLVALERSRMQAVLDEERTATAAATYARETRLVELQLRLEEVDADRDARSRGMRSELETLTMQLDAAKQQVADAHGREAAADRRRLEAEDAHRRLDDRVQQLAAQTINYDRSIASLQAELEELQGVCEAELISKSQAASSLHHRVATLEERVRQVLAESETALATERERRREAVDVLEKQLQCVNSEVAEANRGEALLRVRLAALVGEAETFESERRRWAEQKSAFEASISDALQDVASLRAAAHRSASSPHAAPPSPSVRRFAEIGIDADSAWSAIETLLGIRTAELAQSRATEEALNGCVEDLARDVDRLETEKGDLLGQLCNATSSGASAEPSTAQREPASEPEKGIPCATVDDVRTSLATLNEVDDVQPIFHSILSAGHLTADARATTLADAWNRTLSLRQESECREAQALKEAANATAERNALDAYLTKFSSDSEMELNASRNQLDVLSGDLATLRNADMQLRAALEHATREAEIRSRSPNATSIASQTDPLAMAETSGGGGRPPAPAEVASHILDCYTSCLTVEAMGLADAHQLFLDAHHATRMVSATSHRAQLTASRASVSSLLDVAHASVDTAFAKALVLVDACDVATAGTVQRWSIEQGKAQARAVGDLGVARDILGNCSQSLVGHAAAWSHQSTQVICDAWTAVLAETVADPIALASRTAIPRLPFETFLRLQKGTSGVTHNKMPFQESAHAAQVQETVERLLIAHAEDCQGSTLRVFIQDALASAFVSVTLLAGDAQTVTAAAVQSARVIIDEEATQRLKLVQSALRDRSAREAHRGKLARLAGQQSQQPTWRPRGDAAGMASSPHQQVRVADPFERLATDKLSLLDVATGAAGGRRPLQPSIRSRSGSPREGVIVDCDPQSRLAATRPSDEDGVSRTDDVARSIEEVLLAMQTARHSGSHPPRPLAARNGAASRTLHYGGTAASASTAHHTPRR